MKNLYVDNAKYAGEKKCRKKNFFDSVFAFYFAVLTAGKIPITRTNYLLKISLE